MTSTVSKCPVSKFAADFNPFTNPYLADPYTPLAQARREEPVFYSPELDYFVVTRYADVRAIFRDIKSFSAEIALEPITPMFESSIQKIIEVGYVPGPALVNEDEPGHMKRRRRLSGMFTPESVAALEPRIRALVSGYVDEIVRRGNADIVEDLVWEVPALVAFLFMGVPDEDVQRVKQFATRRTLLTWGRPNEDEQNTLIDEIGDYWNFCKHHVERTRQNMGTDFVSEVIRANEEDPELFDEISMYNLMLNFLFAAHETTTNASANGIKTLLEHPDQWRAICEDPSLIPNAVEEILRYSSSVIAWRRLALTTVTVGGVEIPEGSKVLVVLGSANHDEEMFADGEQFDIRRDGAARHLSFGIGTHTCLGAPVARLEMRVIIEELTRRLPHLQIKPGQTFTYSPNTSFRGPEHVLVQWEPTHNPVPEDRPLS